MRNRTTTTGFTLIELLLVIAILGILSTFIIASTADSRDAAKIAATQLELDQIYKSFEVFRLEYNDYPPFGVDHCSICKVWGPNQTAYPGSQGWFGYNSQQFYDFPPHTSPAVDWPDLMQLLRSGGDFSRASARGYSEDAWGNEYYYDKNYNMSCYDYSPICSGGPNGYIETPHCGTNEPLGDDICVFLDSA